jgi:hypothetical protein
MSTLTSDMGSLGVPTQGFGGWVASPDPVVSGIRVPPDMMEPPYDGLVTDKDLIIDDTKGPQL